MTHTKRILAMSEYVVINNVTYPVNTLEEIGIAERALATIGESEAAVWVTPHDLDWIDEHGDPDGYKTGQRIFASSETPEADNEKSWEIKMQEFQDAGWKP